MDNLKPVEPATDDLLEDYFVLDDESLARLREKYCIQCLEILGQHVEASSVLVTISSSQVQNDPDVVLVIPCCVVCRQLVLCSFLTCM